MFKNSFNTWILLQKLIYFGEYMSLLGKAVQLTC